MGTPDGVEITGPMHDRFDEVLTPTALELVAAAAPRARRPPAGAAGRRARSACRRSPPAARSTSSRRPASIREDDSWRVAEPAPGLVDRRVEITGPTDRKMTINALNSGAKVWLADHEDANTPLWENVVSGQLNLQDAIDRHASTSPARRARRTRSTGRRAADDRRRPARLAPAGEAHPRRRRAAPRAACVDFALYLANCAQTQIDRGQGPYFYLPKMESHLEARLWNDAFVLAQDLLGIPRGTIRATVLIETYPAAFEMEEILYELREHSAGLNAGRWDYMFSVIKNFRTRGRGVPAARPQLGDDDGAVHARLHRAAGAHLPQARRARDRRHGGVHPAARTPRSTRWPSPRSRDDKTREADDGFDGSWVAHPGMVEVCREVFDAVLGDRPNQLDRLREDVHGHRRAAARRRRRRPARSPRPGCAATSASASSTCESWLRGTGAVGINNLMEDAATAEISRARSGSGCTTTSSSPTASRSPASWSSGSIEEEMAGIATGGGEAFARAGGTTRARCSPRWRWPTSTPTSSRSRPTSGCRDRPCDGTHRHAHDGTDRPPCRSPRHPGHR